MVSCAGLTCFFKKDSAKIDNLIFQLHYKATAIILLALSIFVAIKQYFGDPIDCITRHEEIPSNLLDNYCWIHTTYSLADSWEKKVGVETPYPGLGKSNPGSIKVYHAYYQWVSLLLFMQAIFFYIPRFFWRSVEGGRIRKMKSPLNHPIAPEETKSLHRKFLVDYMLSNMNYNNMYFICYFIAEVMNFVNVIGQIFLTDAFLGGNFLTYGINVARFTGWDWSLNFNPMIQVFPRLTKCTFYKYGRSGDVDKHDAMCILPINIINEKIYLFLWFWFVILSILSVIVIMYRVLILLVPKFRLLVIRTKTFLADENDLDIIIRKCKIGDWMILDLLSKNIDPLNFRDLISDFARKIDN